VLETEVFKAVKMKIAVIWVVTQCICGLFNDTISISDYIILDDRIINE
jgi:hypothetical protein